MKKFIIACVAAAAFAAPAFAEGGAKHELKDQFPSVDPLKNLVGFFSSVVTGNGGSIGGNGSCDVSICGGFNDQTTGPGTRGDAIQALQALQSRGRDKP